MKHRLLTAASAAALALALAAGGASGQGLGLRQLQDSATISFAQLGMDTSMIDMLTLDELAQVQAATSGGSSDSQKIGQIETILREAEARIAAGGAVAPTGATGDIDGGDLAGDQVVKANVGAFIARLGVQDEIDVDMLTTDELLQIQLIEQGNESDPQKLNKVEVLLDD